MEDVQLLKEGEEVTLMDWGNAIVQTISKSADGKTITGMCLFCALASIHMVFNFVCDSLDQLYSSSDKNKASASALVQFGSRLFPAEFGRRSKQKYAA